MSAAVGSFQPRSFLHNPIPDGFDWHNPDYSSVLQGRWDRIWKLRSRRFKAQLRAFKDLYRQYPVQFIMDWGYTADPRNALLGRPVIIPFLLFDRQIEWCEWLLDHMRKGTPGLTEKSRECGVSWLAGEMGSTLAIFNDGFSAGFGSQKEDKLDRSGDPDTLFWKIRLFLEKIPVEFRAGYDVDKTSAHMRVSFPETGSSETGEAGDEIGRGGRKSVYFVDESAHIPHAEMIDFSLSSNTNCRIDISSVAGMANNFAVKRHSGQVDVFTFSYRDDPRKGPEWLAKQKRELSEVVVKQEIEIDYRASVFGQIINAEHIDAAIGFLDWLGIESTGMKRGALDVADEGIDKNAYAGRTGIQLDKLVQWSGKGSNTFLTTVRAFEEAESQGAEEFEYDADGLGAFVRGDADELNRQRRENALALLRVSPFHGSGAVDDPEGEMVKDRKNKNYFGNRKAQAWWALKIRFQKTFLRRVEGDESIKLEDCISIHPSLRDLPLESGSSQRLINQLIMELCQPTYTLNTLGKVIVDKTPTLPNGQPTKSPNLADSVMMLYFPGNTGLNTWLAMARQLRR